ncbi:MAG: hypothetical protein ABJJ37_05045 [Roseibium sp.]
MKLRTFITAAAAAGLAPGIAVAASEEELVDFLFVQTSESVSLSGGKLRLEGVNPDTLYFSDRPERVVGRFTTEEFVFEWDKGHDSFKSDPPNAVLTVHSRDMPAEVVVVLQSPALDADDLIYDVDVLDGSDELDAVEASLFIDVIGRPLTPMSYAGVARRSGRRTGRRAASKR